MRGGGVEEVGKGIRSGGMPSPIGDKDGPTNHLSKRQRELDWAWRFYRCTNYDGRKFDWDGRENVGKIEHDAIATSGAIPPGFYDAGGSMVPLKFRAPTAPFFLAKVIVNRFTSLLFSKQRHPQIECDDPLTADWLSGFAEESRLWATMIKARTFGGGMGSVGLGFKFVKGKPVVEVHDPRWCTPTFADRELLTVEKFEKLYQFVEQEKNHEGEWEDCWYWYRRVVDDTSDTIWPKVKVEGNETPEWKFEHSTSKEHGFGFCPIVWVQNQPVEDDPDGDSDCHGIYNLIERIDALYAQADRGTVANCDPTLMITSDADFEEIRKGSGNALQVEKGGSVAYMEMAGSGIDKAVMLAEKFEEKALTVARCMLDTNAGGPSRSVEEVEHNYSSMTEQADIYREQYGEKGVKLLLSMVLRAARKMLAPRVEKDGVGMTRIVRSVVRLPKKKVIDPESGDSSWQERELGQGEQIELVWPQYFTPGLDVVAKAVDAASKARQAGLIDTDHAVSFTSEYFHVENKSQMIKKIKAEVAEANAAMMGGMGGGAPPEEDAAARSEFGADGEPGGNDGGWDQTQPQEAAG